MCNPGNLVGKRENFSTWSLNSLSVTSVFGIMTSAESTVFAEDTSYTGPLVLKSDRPLLPLELQERIIISVPQTTPARIAFLCTCALVCKSWVSISRSALAMDVLLKLQCWYPMNALVSSPYFTLGHAIRTIRAVWNDDSRATPECLALLPRTLRRLPAVSKLSIVSQMVPSLISSKACLPNIRTLALSFWKTHSVPPLLTIQTVLTVSFPKVESLRLDIYGRTWADGQFPFGLEVSSPTVMLLPSPRTLHISISKPEDINHLGQVIVASPSLKHLTLRLLTPQGISATSSWLQSPHRRGLLNASVSLCVELMWGTEITCPGLDFLLCRAQSLMTPYYMDTRSISTVLIPWIHKMPQLESLSFSGPLFTREPEIEAMDWEPFVNALEHATHVKRLIVVMTDREAIEKTFDMEPGYMSFLRRIVPPHVSACLWTPQEWDSKHCIT